MNTDPRYITDQRPDYIVEEFSDDEKKVLSHFFTNVTGPVFCLVNLPEVVKGALFARYSRSPKTLRRLFLDEFVGDLEMGDEGIDATIGLDRAESLYNKVFFEYGDDSVAQVGGVHLACEQSSNLLTKILEWARLAAYLEQSTRYMPYDTKFGGNFRYYRDVAIMNDPVLGPEFVRVMDYSFEKYTWFLEQLKPFFIEMYPNVENKSLPAYEAAVRSKLLDNIRGLLPAATISNMGIYAPAQSYENMLMRMRSLNLPEANQYSLMMLEELRKVIGPFMERVDKEDRGNMHSRYLAETRNKTAELVAQLLGDMEVEETPEVSLLDFDSDYEVKLVAAIMAESSVYGEAQLRRRAEIMADHERLAILKTYFGDRSNNRRHKPGRQLEIPGYRFEILSNYGAFRDLQRHRMATMTWQSLTPEHGYNIPVLVSEAGYADQYSEVLEAQAGLFYQLADKFPLDAQPQYALGFEYKMRYVIQINARALTHLVELRTGPAGHEDYRLIAQQMHTLIRDQAGHNAIAEMMQYADHNRYDLGRINAEERSYQKRLAHEKANAENNFVTE